MGILAIILIAFIIIVALICGAVIELFWPIVAVIAAYYLIRWLNGDSSSPNKKDQK